MSFWGGFAGGLNAGVSIRDRWDERAADGRTGLEDSPVGGLLGLRRREDGDGTTSPTRPAGGERRSGGTSSGRGAQPFQTDDPVATDMEPEARAFLNTIAGGESGGRYNVRYTPGGGTNFELNGQHPGIFEAGPAGPSSAAGRYQFTRTTWNRMGGGDFGPENQDRRAWQLAQQDYRTNTGRDLLGDLRSGGVTRDMLSSLRGTWAAFGSNADRHIATYNTSMDRYRASPAGPAGRAAEKPADGAAPAAPAPTAAASPVYDERGMLLPEHGGLAGVQRQEAARTGTASGATTREPTSGTVDDIPEPIRVQPGQISIAPMFNDVPANAAARVAGANPEMDALIAGAGGRPGAATNPAAVNDAAPLIDGRNLPEAAATARGGAATGGRGGAQADVSPTMLIDGRNLPSDSGGAPPTPITSDTFPGAMAREAPPPRPISSDTFPPPAGAARATGGPPSDTGGRASARADVPAARPSPRTSASSSEPTPRAAAAPSRPPAASPGNATRTAPVPEPRPTPAPATSSLSERDRIMLLRDEGSLAPGEAERLRAGLPNFAMFGLGAARRDAPPAARPAAPAPPERAAQRSAAATRPAAPEPIRREAPGLAGQTAPVAAPEESSAMKLAEPAGTAEVPLGPQAATLPLPQPSDDAQRFSNIRVTAQGQLDRGTRPEVVARRLAAAGVPMEEWPESLRPRQASVPTPPAGGPSPMEDTWAALRQSAPSPFDPRARQFDEIARRGQRWTPTGSMGLAQAQAPIAR